MREEQEAYFEDNDVEELVLRFEESLSTNIKQYFDVCEFEIIIDFYLDNFQLIKADDALKAAFSQHPGSVSLQLKKCQVLLEKEQPEEAIKILEKFERMESSDVDFYICKGHAYCFFDKVVDAEIEFNKALKISIEEKDEVYVNIVSILIQFEFYASAKKFLLKARDEFPRDCDILQELAVCCYKLDETESAIDLYNYILDIDPYHENAWFNLGLVYEKDLNYTKAIEAYEFAIAINEYFSIAYLNLGNVYLFDENYQQAIKAYSEYLSFDENSPDIMLYIGECYEKMKDFSKAREYYQKALSIDPAFADAWYSLGILEMSLENYFESIDYLKKAIEINNDNVDYHKILGNVYLKLGLYSESKQMFKKAIKYDVYDYESWLLFSEVYWLENKYEKAIEVLKEGYCYNNDIAVYNYKLSAYFLATNQKKLAVKYFNNGFIEDNGGYGVIYNYVTDYQIPKEIKSLININN